MWNILTLLPPPHPYLDSNLCSILLFLYPNYDGNTGYTLAFLNKFTFRKLLYYSRDHAQWSHIDYSLKRQFYSDFRHKKYLHQYTSSLLLSKIWQWSTMAGWKIKKAQQTMFIWIQERLLNQPRTKKV